MIRIGRRLLRLHCRGIGSGVKLVLVAFCYCFGSSYKLSVERCVGMVWYDQAIVEWF